MKRIIICFVTTIILCCYFACNKENVPATEDVPVIEDISEIETVPETDSIQPFTPIVLTVKQDEKVNADNYFAFKMFREVSALAEEPNTFFSPLSLNMALGMLYNGVSGDTRTEMAETLGMADFTDIEINEYYQKMSQTLLEIDPLTEISIANSIWYREGFPVKQSFFDINQTYFDAIVKALDFSKPDAADIINQWCAEKTKDRIEEIVENPISDLTVMFLINAIYFKSTWQFEFDKVNTKQDDFTKANNQKVRVNMMEQTTTLPYYADQYLQCVEMPYSNQAFSMVAILPSNEMDIERLIDYLDNTTWQHIMNNMYLQNIWLKLPRFKVECEISLNDPVKNAGMKLIFDEWNADLSNISDDFHLFVSNIKQKTFVEVNEEGTEAAAVTAIGIVTGELIPQPMFFANRPFLYLIKEKSTGAILFIGRMDEPKE